MCCCHGLSLGYHLYNSAVSVVTQTSHIPGHSRTVCEMCTLQEIMVQVMIMLHLGSQSEDGSELNSGQMRVFSEDHASLYVHKELQRLLQCFFFPTSKTICSYLDRIHFCAMV